MLEINEPIDCWVLFKKNSMVPSVFLWRDRKIKIDKINLMHTTRDNACVLYHFSVSSGQNFYRLQFDPSKLNWTLEFVEED